MRELAFFKRKVMSGYIRAEQIAVYLGAKINPWNGFENDVCIFVKWTPAIYKWGDRWLDIVDRHQCLHWLRKHEDCGVIAISKTAAEWIGNELPRHRITIIPQQHCNFDREKRPAREAQVVGYCGEYHTFAPFKDEVRGHLAEIGLELRFYHEYHTRQDVIDFYKTIDIQLVWRLEPGYVKELKNPLKLSNAGSFGIPTVAYPEANFVAEWDGCFVPATSLRAAIDQIDCLAKNDAHYHEMAERAELRAEEYHISKIAEKYRRLAA